MVVQGFLFDPAVDAMQGGNAMACSCCVTVSDVVTVSQDELWQTLEAAGSSG